MKVLDLFSGIGGFSLGLERAGMETVAFCELSQACPNGCWSTEHETFEVEGIMCPKCKNEFKVEGLCW